MAGKTDAKYKQSTVEKVEACGQCQMTLQETALLAGVGEGEVEDGELATAYMLGKLEAELAVRRSLLQKAQDGDGNAQKEFLKIASESRVDAI